MDINSVVVNLLVYILVILEVEPGIARQTKVMTLFNPSRASRVVQLESKFSYSVQLILQKGDHESSLPPNFSMPHTFLIKAPEYSYFGLSAIVQSLKFRENGESNDTCKDYIQFDSLEGKSDKICGYLPKGESGYFISTLHGPRTYYTKNGSSIKLTAYVGPAASHAELNLIGAEIVFTAYTVCPELEGKLKTVKRCSEYEMMSCIPSELFCDSKIDCGFESEFGMDESLCFLKYIYIATAVLAIVLVLIIIVSFRTWLVSRKNLGKNESHAADSFYGDTNDAGMYAAVEAVDVDASAGMF